MPRAPYVNQYEIGLRGLFVEAEDLGGALTAAATLVDDAAELGDGRTKALRRDVTIWKDGQYDGIATQMARDGRRR